MQVLCERSNTASDVRCGVCGQGFLVYWDKTMRAKRVQARNAVMRALSRQHQDAMTGHDAHPETQFAVASLDPDHSEGVLLREAGVVSA